METLDLNPYSIKILTSDENKKIFKSIENGTVIFSKTGADIILKKISSISIILCTSEIIGNNFNTLDKNVILFTFNIYDMCYGNACYFMCYNYKQPSIKDILLKNYLGTYFYNVTDVSAQRFKFNNNQIDIINDKVRIYFTQVFILLKEICIIDDITKHIYMLFIKNIFDDE